MKPLISSRPPPLTISLRAKLIIAALVIGAVLFAIYGPDSPKGITFSGPVTMLVLAGVIWWIADWRMNRAAWRWRYTQQAVAQHNGIDLFDADPASAGASQAGGGTVSDEDVINAVIANRQWGRL